MVREAEIIVFVISTQWRTLSTVYTVLVDLLHESLIHFRGGAYWRFDGRFGMSTSQHTVCNGP